MNKVSDKNEQIFKLVDKSTNQTDNVIKLLKEALVLIKERDEIIELLKKENKLMKNLLKKYKLI
jgi:hypothetical protein